MLSKKSNKIQKLGLVFAVGLGVDTSQGFSALGQAPSAAGAVANQSRRNSKS